MISDDQILSERNVGYVLEKYYNLENLGGSSTKAATLSTVSQMLELDLTDIYPEKQLSASNLKYLLSKIELGTYSPYIKLSYIESTGTQYIDTLVTLPLCNHINVEMDCNITETANSYKAVFGSRSGTQNSPVCSVTLWRIDSTAYRADYDTYTNKRVSASTNGRHTIKWKTTHEYGDIDLYIDNSGYNIITSPDTISNSVSMAIFTTHTEDEYDDRCVSMKLYSFKLWDEFEPTVIYEFIPAKRKTDGVAGLYCVQTGLFCTNLGTGYFNQGEELGDLDISGSPYTYLDYIQSQATGPADGSYIDLGTHFQGYDTIEATFQYVDVSNHTHCALFGARGAASSYNRRMVFQYYNNGWRYDYGSNNTEISDIDYLSKLDLVIRYGREVTLSNGTYRLVELHSIDFNTPCNIYLFANNTNGTVGECSNLRIYHFSCENISINKTHEDMDLYPVKRNSDGALGMLDILNNTFYPQTGGLPFIEGPVQGSERDYIPLDYIQSQATGPSDGSYIDLGISPSFRCNIEATFQYVDVSNHTHCALFGVRNDMTTYNDRFTFQYNNNGWRFDYYNANKSASDPSDFMNFKTLVIEDGMNLTMTSTTGSSVFITYNLSIASGNKTPHTLYLFAQNTGDEVGECSNVKLYHFKISDNQGTNLDLYPYKRSSDNAIGLLDINHNKFYTKTGGLDFIAGPAH